MHGLAEAVALPSGLASAGISYPLPGGEVTSIEGLSFALTCAGGGGARQVVVQLQDALGVAVFANAAPGTHASGLTVVYSFGPNVAPFGSDTLGFMGASFPGLRYADNLTVVVQVVSAGGTDTLFDGRLLVCQYVREPQ